VSQFSPAAGPVRQPGSGSAAGRITRHVFVALVTGAAFTYLLYPGGVLESNSNTSFSVFLWPVIGYIVLRLLARLSEIIIPSLTGYIVASLFTWGALSVFSYFFLRGLAALFTGTARPSFELLIGELNSAAPPMILLMTAYTVARLGGAERLLPAGSEWRRVCPALSAAGLFMFGIALWKVFAAFEGTWGPFRGIGLVLLAAMLALTISHLAVYFTSSKNRVIADTSHWLGSKRTAKFFLGALIGAYFIFIRPAMYSATGSAYLIEWIIICFVSWWILATAREGLENLHSVPYDDNEWQKHVQQVNIIVDDEFENIVVMQKSFLEISRREDLLAFIKSALTNNGLDENEIARKLNALTEHRDRKVPWYAFITFGRWKKSILKANFKKRQRAFEETIKDLKVQYPYLQKS
jgi:hypothetical protein